MILSWDNWSISFLWLVLSKKFQCRWICVDIWIHPQKFPVGPGSGLLSGFRFLYFWWSYCKNSDASEFVLAYKFIHKNFRFVRGPVFCTVSGFCTSDGHFAKISMQMDLYLRGRGPVFSPVDLFEKRSINLKIIFPIFCEVIVWKGFSGLSKLYFWFTYWRA